jgi:hypothetical protein
MRGAPLRSIDDAASVFGLNAAGGAQVLDLRVVEDAGANEEAETFGAFEREHSTAAGNDIERELGVLPILELAAAHIEGLAVDFAELNVGVADEEFTARIAHGGAAITAAARLVKHERTILLAQDTDEVNGEIGCEDLFGEIRHRSELAS